MFAGNRLVLAVPADGSKVSSLEDLEAKGVKLAIGAEDVPVGAYTRTVLDKLPAAADARRSSPTCAPRSPTSAGIIGKLTQGAVDAGFLYVTDVARDRRQAEGDRAAGRAAADASPTASRS